MRMFARISGSAAHRMSMSTSAVDRDAVRVGSRTRRFSGYIMRMSARTGGACRVRVSARTGRGATHRVSMSTAAVDRDAVRVGSRTRTCSIMTMYRELRDRQRDSSRAAS